MPNATPSANPQQLTEALKTEAQRLGFVLAGACPAVTPTGFNQFVEWLERGYGGEMHYLRERQDAYAAPQRVLDGARSILMLAMPYRTADPKPTEFGQGRISRYAWSNTDYHDVIHERLKQLAAGLKELAPEARVRGVVDTAPILEREFAQLSGLGWIGKNTLLLNKQHGSWFFLAALLTDLELQYDSPHDTDHCGTCDACLRACPTNAFPEPYVLDATKCISYLTIELRTQVPETLRSGISDWLFGCDVCQEVCPWNRRVAKGDELLFGPKEGANPVDLAELFRLSEQDFRDRFRWTPLWRPRRRGILRNAAIVLGNQASAESIEPLGIGLQDSDDLVRATCAWALGRINLPQSRELLTKQLEREQDSEVRREIQAALAGQAP